MKPRLTSVLAGVLLVTFGITVARAEGRRIESAKTPVKSGSVQPVEFLKKKLVPQRAVQDFRPGGGGKVSVENGIVDLNDRSLELVKNANTATQMDQVPFEVVSVAPPNAIPVGTDEPIKVTFTKKVDPASFRASVSVTQFSLGFVLVPIADTFASSDGKTFWIVPKQPLAPNYGYFVKVNEGVKAAAPSQETLTSAYKWNFYVNEYGGCPEPKITNVQFTNHQCRQLVGPAYSSLDGISEGERIAFDYPGLEGDYRVDWDAENVTWVEDNCHGYVKDTNFEASHGSIEFDWDGPIVATGDRGNGELVFYRRGGEITCRITAHGACGKAAIADYTYSCFQ